MQKPSATSPLRQLSLFSFDNSFAMFNPEPSRNEGRSFSATAVLAIAAVAAVVLFVS